MSCTEPPIEIGNPVLGMLAAELEALKADRHRVDVRISEVERLILNNITAKDEGTVTEKTTNHKLTVTFKMNRKLDDGVWARIRNQIPDNLHPVRYKAEVDTRGIRYLQQNEPDVYLILSEALTTKPAKPYIKVEAIEHV